MVAVARCDALGRADVGRRDTAGVLPAGRAAVGCMGVLSAMENSAEWADRDAAADWGDSSPC